MFVYFTHYLMDGLKAIWKNQQVFLEIKHNVLLIKSTDSIRKIEINDILVMQTKQVESIYYFKLKLKDETIILEFNNFHSRDLCKALLTSTTSYKEINYDTSKFINSLSPPLLSIFSDMNCSVSQFYNFLIQSNFYDCRNKYTPIDRLISEKLRGFKIDNNNLVRINNYSLLMVNDETKSTVHKVNAKEVEFEPIYWLEEESNETMEDMEIEVEENVDVCNIDIKILKKMVEVSKKVFNKENIDLSEFEKFKEINYLKRILPFYFIKNVE